jgi:3-hydroxyisobutyrate dehydrogenase-like beta-hydroxyacid dehydrogenase
MRVGFIGLGMTGKGVAANLQKAGHEFVVHGLKRAAAEPFSGKGCAPGQFAEGGRRAERDRLNLAAGAGRCRAGRTRTKRADRGQAPDTAFFDMSTNSVAVVRKISAAFAEKNLYTLDSPVSGGPSGAASGEMAIWVGGDEQIFNRHKRALDAMGDQAA